MYVDVIIRVRDQAYVQTPHTVRAGAYLGGALGHSPPLDRLNSIISIEKYTKLWHGPLCNLGRRFEHINGGQRPFLAKNRTKFE